MSGVSIKPNPLQWNGFARHTRCVCGVSGGVSIRRLAPPSTGRIRQARGRGGNLSRVAVPQVVRKPAAAQPIATWLVSIKVNVTTGNLVARAEEAARVASEKVLAELFAAFQQSFTAKAWEWPYSLATRKLSGANLAERVASFNAGDGINPGSPRNLIDTGNLRQTGSFRMVGPFKAEFRWSANYATAVHEGAYIWPWGNRNAARVYLPPRPWTRAVLGLENVPGIKTYDLGDRLQNVWLQAMRRRRPAPDPPAAET